MPYDERIEAVAEAILNDWFDGAPPLSIASVEEDREADGAPTLRLVILYEAEKGALDGARIPGVHERLRAALAGLEETRPPVLRFIEAAEFGAMKDAPA